MRPSFIKLNMPFLATIVEEPTAAKAKANILASEHDGSQAFVLDLSRFSQEDLAPDVLRQLIHFTGRPVMPLCYRANNFGEMPDDARVDLMLRAIDAGAAGVDIMGDLFDPAFDERTKDPFAIAKQKALIEQVHSLGAEVLISTHTYRRMTCAESLEHMLDLQSRGADIVKLVARADTEEEFLESLQTTVLLAKKLDVPFVHLCVGRFGRLQRYSVPMLGAMLTFSVQSYTEFSMGLQPTVAAARMVLNELRWASEYPQEYK